MDTLSEAMAVTGGALEHEFEARLTDSSRLAFRVALGVLHNAADAEDVAQEAFVKAYQNFARLRDRERFRAWLARIAWRLAIDRVRSAGRREQRELDWVEASPELGVEQAAASSELRQQLHHEIDALPEKLRQVLILAAIEGNDMRETAELLGIREGTVRSRLFAARKRLAKRLRGSAP